MSNRDAPASPLTPADPAPETLSFEALMAEIDRVTTLLERGDAPLETALAAFERGMSLSKKAASLLDQAEARLLRLVERERGEVTEVPLDLEASATPRAPEERPEPRAPSDLKARE